jgi:excisionase family DNA binding protein
MKRQVTVTSGIAPAVMTVREVADYLRVHPSTIYRLLKQGQIPGFRIDGDWRFHVKTIDEWRARKEARPSRRASSKDADQESVVDNFPDSSARA